MRTKSDARAELCKKKNEEQNRGNIEGSNNYHSSVTIGRDRQFLIRDIVLRQQIYQQFKQQQHKIYLSLFKKQSYLINT